MTDVARAGLFLIRNGRLLERLVFAHRFQGASAEPVINALRAYQNDDGGFGHALEPDLRGPDSQPVHVDFAFRVMHDVGVAPPDMIARACSFLGSVATESASVPAILESATRYPRAEHWQVDAWRADGLNPTAMIAGLLHAMHVGNAWLQQADAFCWRRITEVKAEDGPTIAAIACFLNNAPDRRRAVTLAEEVADAIPDANFFALEPEDMNGYALTPLDLGPTPNAMVGNLFAPELLDAHLDALEARQQPDGGWPVTWDPPAGVAALEWRGRVTIDALIKLQAYGRI
jgi:hypothetical protein